MLITVSSNTQGHKTIQWCEAVQSALHQPWKAYVSGQTWQRWEIQEEIRSKVHTEWFCVASTSWRCRGADIRETNTHTLPFTRWCGSVWWVHASFQRDHNFCTLSLLKHFKLQCTCTSLQPLSLLSTLNAKHNSGYSRAAVHGGYNSYPEKALRSLA